MPLNRIEIEDTGHEAFGALIKKWARGQIPFPTTPDELKAQFTTEGITVRWPTGTNIVTEVNVFQGATQKLDLRVPPLSFIEESEEFLANNTYILPRYYEDLFGVAPDFSTTDPIRFHNSRVGDYTIANCV